MPRFVHVPLAILVFTAVLPAASHAQLPASDLMGKWQAVKIVVNGEPAPTYHLKDSFFVFTADHIKVNIGDLLEENLKYTVVKGQKNPRHVDFSPPGNGTSLSSRGIYKVEGGTLTICFSMPFAANVNRPATFASRTGSNHGMLVLRRFRSTERK